MKVHIMSLVVLAMFAVSASAEVSESKPVTKIDFNGMIQTNSQAGTELKKGIDESAETAALEERADKTKVVDFIDLEVGWDEGAPVVEQRPVGDRRYNSVDETSKN
jgi:hypothetical protein